MATAKKISLPKFYPGEVVDLSYKNGGLPNRIQIERVILGRELNWNYEVILENLGEVTNMEEPFILDRMVNTNAEVYKVDEIVNRYAQGWRFCGNYTYTNAHETGRKLANNNNIDGVRIYDARNPSGTLVVGSNPKNKGLWIRYKHPLYGNIQQASNLGYTVIK